MRRGPWRSIAVGGLSLIALQVFLSGTGPEAGSKLLLWLNTGLEKLLSPKVAAIPYVAKAAAAPAAKPTAPGISYQPGPIGLPTNPPVST